MFEHWPPPAAALPPVPAELELELELLQAATPIASSTAAATGNNP
jgi:hypothetical protein